MTNKKKKPIKKKSPPKKTTTKKRSSKMRDDQNELIGALMERLTKHSPKPPELVPMPYGDNWVNMKDRKISVVIENKGGDMDRKVKVKLIFVDGPTRGEGDDKTAEPQELEIDIVKEGTKSGILRFDTPSEGENPFDPDFPIEIIIDEGGEWRRTKTFNVKEPSH